MSNKATSLLMTTFTVNSLALIEQLQNVTIDGTNTLVDARGIADRYQNMQATKQKQTINAEAHWYNSSTSLESSNLDITLWTLGGTAYLGQVKSGTLTISNSGPETSGIAVAYEYPQPTATGLSLTSDLMVITEAAFTYEILTAAYTGLTVTVAVTWAGEPVTFPGILKMSKHTVRRGEVQMENVTIESTGAPTTTGDTTSLVYLAGIGAAVTAFTVDTGVNEYVTGMSQYAMISRMELRFADKQLTTQSITLEVQGAMTVTEGV